MEYKMNYTSENYAVGIIKMLTAFFRNKLGSAINNVLIGPLNERESEALSEITIPTLIIVPIGPGRNLSESKAVDSVIDGKLRRLIWKERRYNLSTILGKKFMVGHYVRDHLSSMIENLEFDVGEMEIANEGYVRKFKIYPGNDESTDEWWVITNLLTFEVGIWRDV